MYHRDTRQELRRENEHYELARLGDHPDPGHGAPRGPRQLRVGHQAAAGR